MMTQSTLFLTAEPVTKRRRNTPPKKLVKGKLTLEPKPFPFELDTIQQMDCLEGMRHLPDHSVDMAIADPPYNASKGGEWKWDNSVELPGFGGNWSKVKETWDSMGLTEYLSFTAAWISELKRVVRPTGSIWIHGTYHNIGLINFLLQSLKIEIINEVVWFKRNSFPNLAGRRLTASHETILWAHTGKKREYLFNYEASKKMPCPEDSLKSAGKQMRTVWDIPNNKDRDELKHGKHPTQKPIRLLTRMLELSSKPDWVCLVPFAGAGSECVAAKRAGLRFLAFEIDPNYVKISNKRIKSETPRPLLLNHSTATHEKSVPSPAKKKIAALDEAIGGRRIPSLIKWTGSKRSQAEAIWKLMPEYRRYFEPFVGGGAMLYLAARPGSIGGDLYAPLVDLWKLVQSDPDAVVKDYESQWKRLQASLPAYFYKVRERFNHEPNPLDLSFLMRTCVNGIVRFNDSGQFNNSFHLSRKGMEPRRFEQAVRIWSERLRGVRFLCQDYEATVSQAREGDFVYFDPPYAGNHQRYVEDLDIERFYKVLESLNHRGVKWAWSFDGQRGGIDLSHEVPRSLYKRRMMLASGNSAVGKVLNGPVEQVEESLYLNYD
jgi:site-specific DNA-methyltransferase (adenine-specific)